jgi:monothiol glutaredoxin
MSSQQYIEEIKKELSENAILLYAKGTKEQPRCGFSAATIEILKSYNLPFEVRDVLMNPDKKEALKEFSQWPTIPQLYVKGELIGGCDITRELHETGELKEIFAGISNTN